MRADEEPQPLSGGQTNQLWRVGDVVVKSYAEPDGNPIFPNSPMCEASVLQRLSGHEISPRFIGQAHANGRRYLVYEFLEGTTWTEEAGKVGVLLRRLHDFQPPVGLRVLAGGSRQVSSQVAGFQGALSAELVCWLEEHKPTLEIEASERRVLLHGDPVPGNIVVTPNGVRLIDWQCPAVGDAVQDLALFLSPAMQLIYRGAPLCLEERQTFLAAYGNPTVQQRLQAMQPWYHWAMIAYCAWKTERGAGIYAQAMQLERAALEQCLNQCDCAAANDCSD